MSVAPRRSARRDPAARTGILALGILLLATLAQAAPPEIGPGPQSLEFPAAGIHALRVDLHCGDIKIERASGDVVQAELRVRCERNRDRCFEKLADVKLEGREQSGRLVLEVEGVPRWHSSKGMEVDLTLRVPAHLELDIDLGAGVVHVEDATRNVRIDLGAGQIDAACRRMPFVRSTHAPGSVRRACTARMGNEIAERRHLVGGVVHWQDGKGEARVDVEVGAGEVVVRLE